MVEENRALSEGLTNLLNKVSENIERNPLWAFNALNANVYTLNYRKKPDFLIAYAEALLACFEKGITPKPLIVHGINKDDWSWNPYRAAGTLLEKAIYESADNKNPKATLLLADVNLKDGRYFKAQKYARVLYDDEASSYREKASEILSRALYKLGENPNQDSNDNRADTANVKRRYAESMQITEESLLLFPSNIGLLRCKIAAALALDNVGDKEQVWQKVAYDTIKTWGCTR
jgi:hypothetical protein